MKENTWLINIFLLLTLLFLLCSQSSQTFASKLKFLFLFNNVAISTWLQSCLQNIEKWDFMLGFIFDQFLSDLKTSQWCHTKKKFSQPQRNFHSPSNLTRFKSSLWRHYTALLKRGRLAFLKAQQVNVLFFSLFVFLKFLNSWDCCRMLCHNAGGFTKLH